jgi:hypothetical protein
MTTQAKNVLLVDDEEKLLKPLPSVWKCWGLNAVHGNQWHGGN